MGARFTASDAALAPVLREAGKRGLLYLDDGSSQRSLAGQIAGATTSPSPGRSDHRRGAVGADVDRALGRLETMARERGDAVGWQRIAGLDRADRQMGESRRGPRRATGADQRGDEAVDGRQTTDDREQAIADDG